MAFPALEEMLEKRCVFLFGAGSSLDYGFPSWVGLFELILDNLRVEKTSNDNVASKIANDWLNILESMRVEIENNEITIDHLIAEEAKTKPRREFIVGVLSKVLWNGEKIDLEKSTQRKLNLEYRHSSSLWIQKFSNSFISLFERYESQDDRIERTIQILENTKFVSLNYERCFAYHFFPQIHEFLTLADFGSYNFLEENIDLLRNFFRVHQPHGSFGTLGLQRYNGNPISNVRSDHGIREGSYKSDIMSPSYGSMQPSSVMHLVGESDLSRNYSVINTEVITDKAVCIILGCSGTGVKGAQLHWDKFSEIYFCSKTDKFPVKHKHVHTLPFYAEDLADHLSQCL